MQADMNTAESPGVMPGRTKSSVALQRGKQPPSRAPAENGNIVIKDDRRRFQRVNIPLLGRFMRANGEEYPCKVINASAGGVAVQAPVSTEAGERIVLYVDVLGRIEGNVSRIYADGFALRVKASAYKREKIANQLTWLVNRETLSRIEDRRHDRITPRRSRVKLGTHDGATRECEIFDISLGGAAVSVDPKPEIGQIVTLGLIRGRVIRHSGTAVSIEFLEIQDPATLERQFG